MTRVAALVTGAGRGIGKAIAVRLALEGMNVAVNDVTPEDSAREAVALCREAGVESEYFAADIADSRARAELVLSIKSRFERLDVLVNNAGVAPRERRDLLQATEESFDRVISVNLKGPYFLTQLVSRWMVEQKREHPNRDYAIVSISSISAVASSPERGEYCVSKAGISMMTRLYAHRLAREGIRVFEVQPGIIYTDMTVPVKEKYDLLLEQGTVPIARWGQPEDVADAVAMLVGSHYRYSTGEVVHVDGGLHLPRF